MSASTSIWIVLVSKKYPRPLAGFPVPLGSFNSFLDSGRIVVCAASEKNGRLFQFTQLNEPSVDGFAEHLDLVDRSCISVDDSSDVQNPDPIKIGGVYPLAAPPSTPVLRGGSEVKRLIAPLTFTRGEYRLIPQSEDDLEIEDLDDPDRNLATPFVTSDDDVKVASTNVLNYFQLLDQNGNKLLGQNPRGADNEEEYMRQVQKTFLALSIVDADIFLIVEIENSMDGSKDFVQKLNSYTGFTRNYKAVSVEAGYENVGTDVIKVDIVYDSNILELKGSAILDDDVAQTVAPTIFDMAEEYELNGVTTKRVFEGKSRASLAATFSKNGNMVTVVSNHFKSKGPGNAVGKDLDQLDGQGAYNFVRTLSAQIVVEWLMTAP